MQIDSTICIVGLGYVGLPLVIAFADKGFLAVGLDVDPDKVESLNAWTVCCGNHDANPPVFAICNDCGSVTEHFDEGLSQNLESMSKESGFTPDRSIIEIHGQCDDCFTYKTQ